jgi:RNA polymerase sigma-70 factor (ECF subfamily)
MKEDPDLVERLRQGDDAAWGQVYINNLPMIRKLGYSQNFPEDVIDDVVQDTMLCAVKGIDRFNNCSKLSTWIFRIAINHYRQQINRKTRKTRGYCAYKESVRMTGTNTDGYVRRQLEARSDIIKVSRSLSIYTPRSYESIMLNAFGYTLNEISEIIDAPVSTAGSRLQVGRRDLRERRDLGLLQ